MIYNPSAYWNMGNLAGITSLTNNMNYEKKTERVLEINTDTIALYQVLKLEGLASSGGEAKLFIADGQVSVNGDVETRKRKKIVAGDLIQFAGERISIHRK